MNSHSWTPTIAAARTPGTRRDGRRRTRVTRAPNSARAEPRKGKRQARVARVSTTRQPKISSAPQPGSRPASRKITAKRTDAVTETATPRAAVPVLIGRILNVATAARKPAAEQQQQRGPCGKKECPRRGSNPDLPFRRGLSYPLDYRGASPSLAELATKQKTSVRRGPHHPWAGTAFLFRPRNNATPSPAIESTSRNQLATTNAEARETAAGSRFSAPSMLSMAMLAHSWTTANRMGKTHSSRRRTSSPR